jgi:uncharacterized membrane protein YhhN
VKKSAWFFPIVFVLETIAIILDSRELQLISKPLIVPSLVIFYFFNQPVRNKIFLFAMFFCWLGDVFLMFDQVYEWFFMLGLGAFLIGHINFILCYRELKSERGEGLNNPQKLRFAFPVLLIGTGLITILYPKLGDLKIPVVVYALVLSLMVIQAIFRYGFTSWKSFWLMTIGAMSFMLSDSLLAINKFLSPLPNAGLSIMFTYMLAQYLITLGAAEHR